VGHHQIAAACEPVVETHCSIDSVNRHADAPQVHSWNSLHSNYTPEHVADWKCGLLIVREDSGFGTLDSARDTCVALVSDSNSAVEQMFYFSHTQGKQECKYIQKNTKMNEIGK